MSILSHIGNTPLVSLDRLSKSLGLPFTLFAKCEMFNPFGSVKDRTAFSLLEAAVLPKGALIAEATSGNLGISLCAIGALKGYETHIFLPGGLPQKRYDLIQKHGGILHLTTDKNGMQGAMTALDDFHSHNPCAYLPHQFTNPLNPLAHFNSTAPEIWSQTHGMVDVFIAGIGTAGTLMGTARYLKSRNAAVQIIGIEPAAAPVLTKGISGSHRIYGIGAGFVPPLFDPDLCDRIVTVTNDAALEGCKLLLQFESIHAGPSSGAALSAALSLKNEPIYVGKNIVILLPDSGERY